MGGWKSAIFGMAAILCASSAGAAENPRFEVMYRTFDNAGYAHFANQLMIRLYSWWQREGRGKIPPQQRWRVEISATTSLSHKIGASVEVQRLDVVPGTEADDKWEPREIFCVYPLPARLEKESAAVAAAAISEFMLEWTNGPRKERNNER